MRYKQAPPSLIFFYYLNKMADLVLFDRPIELFEFDWCQCPLDVLNKLKTNSLLKFFLWGQNKFVIVDIDNKVTKNVQQTIYLI